MNNFTKAENRGRDYFQSWLSDISATEIEFTADLYECVDCNFKYKDCSITAEIKVRDLRYRHYQTHIMEVIKYNNVVKYKREHNKDLALFVNFFGENWLYVYQVNKIPLDAVKMWDVPRTTAEDTGRIYKDMIEIPTEIAQIFYRPNKESKWEKQ